MKDIILWQSRGARERKERHLRELSLLHRSTMPPSELLQPVPRKLRWKRSLKFIVGFDAALLACAIGLMIAAGIWITRFHNDVARESRRQNEKMRQVAAQSSDADKRAKAERAIREGEEFERKWCALYVAMLAGVGLTFVAPVFHVGVNWFIHIRPNLLLLREGAPVHASVIQRKRTYLLVPAVEFGFTADRGEHIRRTQPLARLEARLFGVGDSVWILYLPRRPKLACIYGLKSTLARIVTV